MCTERFRHQRESARLSIDVSTYVDSNDARDNRFFSFLFSFLDIGVSRVLGTRSGSYLASSKDQQRLGFRCGNIQTFAMVLQPTSAADRIALLLDLCRFQAWLIAVGSGLLRPLVLGIRSLTALRSDSI